MPKIQYQAINFQSGSLKTLEVATGIIADFESRGFSLTLRQLYYQLVARGYIENTDRSYKRIGSLINDARLAGVIDWDSITDRTRAMKENAHWDDPKQILRAAISQYRRDTREGQPNYVEVWVEKEALVDVVGQACRRLDVPFFACRGYVSQTAMWDAAQRLIAHDDQDRYIIHLGDHDPSGVDMTRDIEDRLTLFGAGASVQRIALNLSQIDRYSPPPNPAKVTDSRSSSYIQQYGNDSWELDALDPAVIKDLIEDAVNDLTDFELLEVARSRELEERQKMSAYTEKLDL